MKLIHEDRDFADLVRIVGAEHQPPIATPLVEKDYWVTHTLWSVQRCGLECWFKGGTSLSKGFGLIRRFSEDLDLQLGPGTAKRVPAVTSRKGESAKHVTERKRFFEAAERALVVRGAKVELHRVDDRWRTAELRVLYPSVVGLPMPAPINPFVVIEAGSARVVPSVARDLGSFVHDALERRGMLGEFEDNRPRAVACVHPLVTLIEKLDAITRRFPKPERGAATFVRHYEDAARVVEAAGALPELGMDLSDLIAGMVESHEIASLARATDTAFLPANSDRWAQVERAYAETQGMFFGPRVGLAEACSAIRGWLRKATRG